MTTTVRKQSETWCTVNLHDKSPALAEQCPHVNARGRYVVMIRNEWHCFEPATRMQANFWVDSQTRGKNRAEVERRIHWQCFECGSFMPLGSYGG